MGINNVQNVSQIEAGKATQRSQPAADVKAKLWSNYYLVLQKIKNILEASHDGLVFLGGLFIFSSIDLFWMLLKMLSGRSASNNTFQSFPPHIKILLR